MSLLLIRAVDFSHTDSRNHTLGAWLSGISPIIAKFSWILGYIVWVRYRAKSLGSKSFNNNFFEENVKLNTDTLYKIEVKVVGNPLKKRIFLSFGN